MIEPRHEESVRWLRFVHPDERWLLNTIKVGGGVGDLHGTFRAGQEDEVHTFLEKAAEADLNVYFSVNPPSRDMAKKALRTDIARMSFLHVDLDPRTGEDFEAERKRLMGLLTTNLPEGVPAPSAIVDSGGGFWGFWRLDEPFEIEGDEARYEEAKLYNLQLELLFGADSCHNVDRIARLPGTVNWPDKRKLKKGRTAALSTIVDMNGASYPLSTFTKAPQLQTALPKGQRLSTGSTVKVDENVRRIMSLDELPNTVNDFCKTVIAQGFHPDEPDRWADEGRSGALWYVVCELVRAGVSDDMIYSLITDADWAISESVLDGTNGRPERYAKRQIERAHEFAVDPVLMELNGRYAVVQNTGGGRCRVVYEDPDTSALVYQSPSDFRQFYSNRKVEVGDGENSKLVPAGKWWLDHPQRRSFRSIVFEPGKETASDVYNIWRGWAVNALPGGSCEKYLAHVRENICSGNEEVFEYLLDWMALAVQKPDQPGHTAIVLRGSQGAGKGSFAKHFGKLFGQHFKQVTDAKHLVGSFNAHLRDCVLLFADEAIAAHDRRHESMLKTMVTEENLIVEAKGVDAAVERNYLHLILASNDDWVVPTGIDDRRFVVLDVGGAHIQDGSYFADIARELSSGGYETLLHMLMTRPVAKFDPRSRPRTAALQDQKAHSFSPEAKWFFDALQVGAIDDASLADGALIPTGSLVYDYNMAVPYGDRISVTAMRRFLAKATKGNVAYRQASGLDQVDLPPVHPQSGEERTTPRPNCFVLPKLAELRALFDETHGGPYEWEAVAPEQQKVEEPF